MAAIRSYLARAILKLRTSTLLSQLEGLFGTALAPNVVDKGSDAVDPAEANYLSAAAFAEGRAKLGERGEDVTAVAMHSSVYYYLVQVGALTFSTSALSTGGAVEWGGGGINLRSDEVAFFMGARVIVDDMLEPAATGTSGDYKEYPVYLFGGGVVSEGVQQELRTELDRNILSKQDVMSLDYHYGMHVMGTTWESAYDNPKNAQTANTAAGIGLDAAANWSLAYQTTKLVPIVKMLVNTPLDLSKYA